jgi:hypothetical protein
VKSTDPCSRSRSYEISSLAAGPLCFSDQSSNFLAIISERLHFVIPANQKRPLQVLEIVPVAGINCEKSGIAGEGDEPVGGKMELRIHLKSAGFFVLNGSKGAIDQLFLRFPTDDECDAFTSAIIDSIGDGGSSKSRNAQLYKGSAEQMPRPKKQSRSVMIDLSQDVAINNDTQFAPSPTAAFAALESSQRIDIGGLTESALSPTPAGPIKGREPIVALPWMDEEHRLSTAKYVKQGPSSFQEESEANKNQPRKEENFELAKKFETPNPNSASVATAKSASNREVVVLAQVDEGHLPQQLQSLDSAKNPTAIPFDSPHLQQVANEALRRSIKSLSSTSAKRSDTDLPRAAVVGTDVVTAHHGTSSTPTAIANSTPKMAVSARVSQSVPVRPGSSGQHNTDEPANSSGKLSLKRRHAGKSNLPGEDTVDWDEDLKAGNDEGQDDGKPAKKSKTGISRNVKIGSKKHTATKKGPRTSTAGKKGGTNGQPTKKMQPISADSTLAATRSRRAMPKMSYKEQDGEHQENEDNDSGDKAKRRTHVEHTEAQEQASVPTPSDQIENKLPNDAMQVPHGKSPDIVIERSPPAAEPLASMPEVAVEVSQSNEDISAPPNIESLDWGIEIRHSDPLQAVENRSLDHNKNEKNIDSDEIGVAMQPEAEAVDDSHPMDRQQRQLAINTARKSFGSSLMEIVSHPSMQQIEAPPPAVAKTRHFGDKAAFVDSLKDAVGKSPRKTGNQLQDRHSQSRESPAADVKEAAAASLDGKAFQFAQTRQDLPGRVMIEHEPLPKSELPNILQEEGPASPLRTVDPSKLSAEAQPFHLPVLPKDRDPRVANRPKTQPHTLSPPWHAAARHMAEGTGEPIRTTGAIREPPANEETQKPNVSTQKRRSAPPITKTQQVKRPRGARHTDSNLVMDEPLSVPTETSEREPPKVHEEPDKQVVRQKTTDQSPHKLVEQPPGVRSSGKPHSQQKQEKTFRPASHINQPGRGSSRSPLKPVQPKAQTPRRPTKRDQPPILTDDRILRKAQIVGFSVTGPRNQGLSSSGARRQQEWQSSSVPTETGKHLAFKKLHTESKAKERQAAVAPKTSQILDGRAKRKVEFQFSDRESSDSGIHVDEESADFSAAAPAVSMSELGKSASQNSKVDENGSPRLNVGKPAHISPSSRAAVVDDIPPSDQGSETPSDIEPLEMDGPDTDESEGFGLEAAVSTLTAAKPSGAAKAKAGRNRTSIGLGPLLDHSFPQSSKGIDTTSFKLKRPADPIAPIKTVESMRIVQLERGSNQKQDYVPALQSAKLDVAHDETPTFDVQQLNVSAANDQPSSVASGRVRRVRSVTPPRPAGGVHDPDASPPSFNTRLGKMVMPPPPRRDQISASFSVQQDLDRDKEPALSRAMEADTTLVNGDTSSEDASPSSPQRHRQVLSASPSSDENEIVPISVSQQLPRQALHDDRQLWNLKVAATQQTLIEILNQVSQVIPFLLIPNRYS